MLIHIEYWKDDKLLHGKRKLTRDELTSITEQIFLVTDEDGFVSAFCEKLGFVEIPYNKYAKADFLIDLDTRTVFNLIHSFPRELDNAKVLYYTEKGDFGAVYWAGGQAVANYVSYLAICTYQDDKNFYLFNCDENCEVVADGCLDSIERGLQVGRDINPNVVWHKHPKNDS